MEVLRLVLHLAATEDGNEADKSCGHVNSDIQENPPCLTMLLPAPHTACQTCDVGNNCA